MAILLYGNGITETYKPKNLVFTEDEIIDLFSEFETLKSYRMSNILNTWCVYGANDNEDDYNRIASMLTKETINSHVLFIHDSEINPSWKVTDDILYKNYSEFNSSLNKLINQIAQNIIEEYEVIAEQNYGNVLPQLEAVGTTGDKRILFLYDPNNQMKQFYGNEDFYTFSKSVFTYLVNNKQKKEPFVIYEDKKALIMVETKLVSQFLTSLIDGFKRKEEYEVCTQITKIMDDWTKISNKPKKSRRSKNSKDKTDE